MNNRAKKILLSACAVAALGVGGIALAQGATTHVASTAATAAAQSRTAATATPGTQVGCRLHQAQATTNSATHASASSTTAHHGRSSTLAP